MWLVIACPVSQCDVSCVLKKKRQFQCLNVGITKYDVGFAMMTIINPFRACVSCLRCCCLNRNTSDHPLSIGNDGAVSAKSIANGYHLTWTYD